MNAAHVTSAMFTAFSAERMVAGAKTQTRRLAWTDDRIGTERDAIPMKSTWQRRRPGDFTRLR